MQILEHLVAVEARADALELQAAALAYQVDGLKLVVLALCNSLQSGLVVAEPDGTQLRVELQRIAS